MLGSIVKTLITLLVISTTPPKGYVRIGRIYYSKNEQEYLDAIVAFYYGKWYITKTKKGYKVKLDYGGYRGTGLMRNEYESIAKPILEYLDKKDGKRDKIIRKGALTKMYQELFQRYFK